MPARTNRGGLHWQRGGTILLDEIGDVSPAMQIRLLRVLQERVYEPLGSVYPVEADVRVIAATNKDLGKLVRKGTFREDLYYRINVIRIDLPPLKDRREDIPLLIDHFVAKFNKIQNKDVVGVTEEVMAVLMEYDYPGNVRELENLIERAFVLCKSGFIGAEHLPSFLHGRTSLSEASRGSGAKLKDLEAMHISDALRRHGGNRTKAAQELGIDPSTLFRKMKSLDLELPKGDGRSKRSSA